MYLVISKDTPFLLGHANGPGRAVTVDSIIMPGYAWYSMLTVVWLHLAMLTMLDASGVR